MSTVGQACVCVLQRGSLDWGVPFLFFCAAVGCAPRARFLTVSPFLWRGCLSGVRAGPLPNAREAAGLGLAPFLIRSSPARSHVVGSGCPRTVFVKAFSPLGVGHTVGRNVITSGILDGDETEPQSTGRGQFRSRRSLGSGREYWNIENH